VGYVLLSAFCFPWTLLHFCKNLSAKPIGWNSSFPLKGRVLEEWTRQHITNILVGFQHISFCFANPEDIYTPIDSVTYIIKQLIHKPKATNT
jgi:hypothetical protein